MIFIIFDIEIVFLYPWAVMFHQLGTFGLVEVIVFAVVVFIAFVYLVSQRGARLGPGQAVCSRAMPSTRTLRSRPSRRVSGRSGAARDARPAAPP